MRWACGRFADAGETDNDVTRGADHDLRGSRPQALGIVRGGGSSEGVYCKHEV